MKNIIVTIVFSVLAVVAFTQTDSSLYKSYINMIDAKGKSLDAIEGIWELDIKTSDIVKKVSKPVSDSHYTVAIYKADKYFVVKYLSKGVFPMERFMRMNDTSILLYDRPEEGIEVRTTLEGIKIVCTYKYTNDKQTLEDKRVFTKQYPMATSTKDQ